MKWMGGWSVADYDQAPADLTDEIVRMMWAEHERYEEARKGRPGASGRSIPVSRDAKGRYFREGVTPKEERKVAATYTDERTGREMVTVEKPDGTVVSHRKIEPGEQILHSMFGKPKSWQNK